MIFVVKMVRGALPFVQTVIRVDFYDKRFLVHCFGLLVRSGCRDMLCGC